jgi:hypothetical protein
MPLDNLLPRNRVHLLAGVRDAGKTRFILPAMLDWQAMPASTCPPWAYVAADRSILDAHDTIRDMGYQISDVPLIPGYGAKRKVWTGIVEALAQITPRPEIVVVEAFQDLCDNYNKRGDVHEFMNTVDSYCHPQTGFPKGLTVVGMTGSPKQCMRDRYPDPSQRVPGSSCWVERASTAFVVESADPKTLSLIPPERRLFVCRKSGPRLDLSGAFTTQNRLHFPNL